MPDYVSRKDVIAVIKKIEDRICWGMLKNHQEGMYTSGFREAINIIVKHIEALPKIESTEDKQKEARS